MDQELKDLNINDELLMLAIEYEQDIYKALSLASICLFELYKKPFFNNQYNKYDLYDDGYSVFMGVGNYSRDGIKYCDNTNVFNYKLVNDLMTKHKKPESGNVEDGFKDQDDIGLGDEYEDDYYDEGEDEKKKILSKEKIKILNNLRAVLEKKDLDIFLDHIRGELQRDSKYLIKLYNVFNNDELFSVIRGNIIVKKENSQDENFNIDIHLKVKNERPLFSNIHDSHFFRDTLNDWFLFQNDRYKKTGKQIVKELLDTKEGFERFLRTAGVLDEYQKEKYSKGYIKATIKKLIKENEYAKIVFKKNPDDRTNLLTKMKFKGAEGVKSSAESILDSLNRQVIADMSIEELVEQNKDKIDKINSVIMSRYPFLESNNIVVNEIDVFVGAAICNSAGHGMDVDILDKDKIISLMPSLGQMDRVAFCEKPAPRSEFDDGRDDFETKMFKSKFSISSERVGFSDGFKLFDWSNFNYVEGKTGFYLDFKYKGQAVGKVSVFQDRNELFLRVGSVEVAKPYQGQGFSYAIYNKLADICEQEKKYC